MPRGVYQRATKVRVYCYERKGVWRSNVRTTGEKTKFIGSYPTKEAATAAANHYIATGSKPAPGMFGGATRTGPKGPRPGTIAKRQNSPVKAVTRSRTTRKAGKPAQQPPVSEFRPVNRERNDRIALWRDAWKKTCGY